MSIVSNNAPAARVEETIEEESCLCYYECSKDLPIGKEEFEKA